MNEFTINDDTSSDVYKKFQRHLSRHCAKCLHFFECPMIALHDQYYRGAPEEIQEIFDMFIPRKPRRGEKKKCVLFTEYVGPPRW